MPTDRLTLDYSFSNDTIDERSQMLNIVGLNPTNASVLFESGFPDNLTINSGARPATVDAIVGGLAQAIQYGFFPLPDRPLTA